MSSFVVRDLRKKEKFQVDDEYLNGYAKLCGPNATLAYLCLCRHADYHTQTCFPSIEMMAEKVGISPASIKRGITSLVEWRIILKERVRHPENAKWVNNSYTLLDKSEWKSKPQLTQTSGSHSSQSSKPQLTEGQSHSSQGASKDIHIEGDTLKETHTAQSAEITAIISSFKEVNPAYAMWFKNNTQRQAIRDLLSQHGREKVDWIITKLPQTNKIPYVPVITTPAQLRDKWSALYAAMQKRSAAQRNVIV